jgi:hypothetical protein
VCFCSLCSFFYLNAEHWPTCYQHLPWSVSVSAVFGSWRLKSHSSMFSCSYLIFIYLFCYGAFAFQFQIFFVLSVVSIAALWPTFFLEKHPVQKQDTGPANALLREVRGSSLCVRHATGSVTVATGDGSVLLAHASLWAYTVTGQTWSSLAPGTVQESIDSDTPGSCLRDFRQFFYMFLISLRAFFIVKFAPPSCYFDF